MSRPAAGPRLPVDHWPIVAILVVGLVVTAWLGNDFGMTFDEERNVQKGETALGVYFGDPTYYQLDHLADHGTVYFMLFSVTSRTIHSLLPSWTEADGRHATHFLMFLLTVFSIYVLSVKLIGRRWAWIAPLLFATQPLLFGNGFINQKDTPFMAFLTATVAAGVVAVDAWRSAGRGLEGDPLASIRRGLGAWWKELAADWRRLPRWLRMTMAALPLGLLAVSLDLMLVGGLQSLGRQWVSEAYAGQAPAPVQSLFEAVATDAYKTELTTYLDKLDTSVELLRLPIIAIAWFLGLIVASFALPSLARAWGFSRDAFQQPWWWVSALLLGAAICVRQLGLFAGGLVSLYMLYHRQNRGLFPLVVYWVVAPLITVATWPYLWPNPIGRFIDSFLLATSFPPHRTFFQGVWRSVTPLPWHYYPTLVGIQLTEPAVLLLVVGIGLAAWRLWRRRPAWGLTALLFVWVAVPLAGLLFFGMTVYGNIRHLLFTLPPLLLMAGLALAWLAAKLPARWQQAALLFVALLPGVIGIARMHPYAYAYYNALVGGASGAFGRYELDRQCISLREGVEVVNRLAEPGAVVMLPRQTSQAIPFARPDLQLVDARVDLSLTDYAVTCYWPRTEDYREQGFEVVYQVRRGDAVLTDVWARPSGAQLDG